jgi:VanZ family protein
MNVEDSIGAMKKRADALFRSLTWISVIALAVLSWTPGSHMVRTGVGGHLEHAAAYLLASAVATIGYGRPGSYIRIGALYCAYAGLLELGQIAVPGRHAGFDDFSASAIGALLGVWMIRLWSTYGRRS